MLKTLAILKDNKNNLLSMYGHIKKDDSYRKAMARLKVLDEAIYELEQYEQNFKQKEFNYRTQCQNILSLGRVEADNISDKLAELEKVILDYYLDKGYKVGVGGWAFNIEIESDYKSKSLLIYFMKNRNEHYSQVLKIEAETTKQMFDEAIYYFKEIK